MFTSAGAFSRTSVYVIRKSTLLGGTLNVTGFGGVASGTVAGPYAPRGVDNDDPTLTQGYFIGVDTLTFSTLQIRRVTNPGSATPTLSANLTLTVPTTTNMVRQWANGIGTANNESHRRLRRPVVHGSDPQEQAHRSHVAVDRQWR